MQISNELRVGIMFLTGLILLVLVIITLTQWGETQRTYSLVIRYRQAQGLEEGAAVHVAGVKVGRVSSISLDPNTNEPLVAVLLDRRVKVYRRYIYAIGVGGIVGEKYVDIIPVEPKGEVVAANKEVQGAERADMNALMDQASVLVAKLTDATGSLNTILGDEDNQRNIKQAITNMNEASLSAAQFTRLLNASMVKNRSTIDLTLAEFQRSSKNAADFTGALNTMMARNQHMVDETVVNLRAGSVSAAEFTASLNDVMKRNQAALDLIIGNLDKTSANAAQFSAALNVTLQRNGQAIDLIVANMEGVSKDLRGVSTSLSTKLEKSQIIENVELAAKRAVDITDRLESIANAVNTMINDQALSDNVRESVASLRRSSEDLERLMADARDAAAPFPEVTANLRDVTDDLRHITAPVREIAPETSRHILQISRNLRGTSDSLSTTTEQIIRFGKALQEMRIHNQAQLMLMSAGERDTRADLNMDIKGAKTMMRLGLTDVGYNDKFNLQFGNRVGTNNWFRYGLVQSSFGIGTDVDLDTNWRFTGEIFTPGDLRANALASYRLPMAPDWAVSAGWYDIFNGNTSSFGLGMQYRPGQ